MYRDGEIPTRTNSQKIVTRNNHNIGNTPIQIRGNDHNRGIQQRSNRRRIQHCSKTQNIRDNLLLGCTPIQRIIGVFRGLRCENDVCVFASAVFKAAGDGFAVGGFVVKEDCSRDVREFVVY